MVIGHTKEVYYNYWCRQCKYRDTEEIQDPCNECLTQGFNIDSHRPINYILNFTNYYDSKRKEELKNEGGNAESK